MTPDRVGRGFTRTLRTMADPKKAEGIQRYFKGTVVALGIDSATVRNFVQKQLPILKVNWSADDAIACCDRMLRQPELEIRGAGVLILGAFHARLAPAWLEQAQRWLEERLDNWALVDTFCSTVLSPFLARIPPTEKTLHFWSGHGSLWVRRASLVTLVPFARKGLLLPLAYELAHEHFGDPEDLMHKATGWLLREAGKTDSRRLRKFLLEHGPAIPRTALRYAIERFPANERKFLLARTRKRGVRQRPTDN